MNTLFGNILSKCFTESYNIDQLRSLINSQHVEILDEIIFNNISNTILTEINSNLTKFRPLLNYSINPIKFSYVRF